MIYLQFSFNNVNTSVQVGDALFYIRTSNQTTTYDYSYEQIIYLGDVVLVTPTTVTISYDDSGSLPWNYKVFNGDYIMFAKDTQVNTSSLKGYYLELEFKNNAKHYAELYSVGSDIVESSK